MSAFAEKRLSVAAWLVVPAVRIALVVLPFRIVHRLAARSARRVPRFSPERIASAVNEVAERLPGTTCLTQVLAAAYLCARYGHPVTPRLGIGRSDGRVTAHAWLESEGRTIIGEPEPGTFVALG